MRPGDHPPAAGSAGLTGNVVPAAHRARRSFSAVQWCRWSTSRFVARQGRGAFGFAATPVHGRAGRQWPCRRSRPPPSLRRPAPRESPARYPRQRRPARRPPCAPDRGRSRRPTGRHRSCGSFAPARSGPAARRAPPADCARQTRSGRPGQCRSHPEPHQSPQLPRTAFPKRSIRPHKGSLPDRPAVAGRRRRARADWDDPSPWRDIAAGRGAGQPLSATPWRSVLRPPLPRFGPVLPCHPCPALPP